MSPPYISTAVLLPRFDSGGAEKHYLAICLSAVKLAVYDCPPGRTPYSTETRKAQDVQEEPQVEHQKL